MYVLTAVFNNRSTTTAELRKSTQSTMRKTCLVEVTVERRVDNVMCSHRPVAGYPRPKNKRKTIDGKHDGKDKTSPADGCRRCNFLPIARYGLFVVTTICCCET